MELNQATLKYKWDGSSQFALRTKKIITNPSWNYVQTDNTGGTNSLELTTCIIMCQVNTTIIIREGEDSRENWPPKYHM